MLHHMNDNLMKRYIFIKVKLMNLNVVFLIKSFSILKSQLLSLNIHWCVIQKYKYRIS